MTYLCSVNGEIHIIGVKVPENKSARERKLPRTWRWSDLAGERRGPGAKGLGTQDISALAPKFQYDVSSLVLNCLVMSAMVKKPACIAESEISTKVSE